MLFQEELLWYQKAKANWLSFKDKNSKFIHATTIIRKKKNKVALLKGDTSKWITNKASLKDMVVCFYKNLYTNDLNNYLPLPKSRLPLKVFR